MKRTMRYRIPILLMTAALASACGIIPGTLPEIPKPTAQVAPTEREVEGYAGLFAPRQRAWPWDADRWFEAEVENSCSGFVYFVDKANGISSYVGYEDAPYVTFGSDDPDVVFGAINAWGQLVFSTDGGRHFVQEVRGYPRNRTPEFVVVRRGHVYVGFRNTDYELDAYFDWHARSLARNARDGDLVDERLVLLEATLDKAAGRIGNYMLLLPTGYRYPHGTPPLLTLAHIKHGDYIEALNLPRSAGARASDACKGSMKLPPWHMQWSHADLVEYLAWYAATKEANPGWANDATQRVVDTLQKRNGNNH